MPGPPGGGRREQEVEDGGGRISKKWDIKKVTSLCSSSLVLVNPT